MPPGGAVKITSRVLFKGSLQSPFAKGKYNLYCSKEIRHMSQQAKNGEAYRGIPSSSTPQQSPLFL